MELSDQILKALVTDVRRRLTDESLSRIRKCLDELSEEEIWHHPNENTVSVGNLLLHLNGNVRQWILSGIGEQPDNRVRDSEFEVDNIKSGDELYSMLENTMKEVDPVLEELIPNDLIKVKNVQGFNESITAILIHVTEHFSYHVGQITYFVKMRKNIDTGYYDGLDLNQK